jgi:hypothetical protein
VARLLAGNSKCTSRMRALAIFYSAPNKNCWADWSRTSHWLCRQTFGEDRLRDIPRLSTHVKLSAAMTFLSLCPSCLILRLAYNRPMVVNNHILDIERCGSIQWSAFEGFWRNVFTGGGTVRQKHLGLRSFNRVSVPQRFPMCLCSQAIYWNAQYMTITSWQDEQSML